MTHPLDLRTEVIQVRLSPREKATALRRKKKHDTLSAHIRRLLAKDATQTKKATHD